MFSVLNRNFPVPSPRFHYMEESSLDIILNISFYVPQKKDAVLEQQEVESLL